MGGFMLAVKAKADPKEIARYTHTHWVGKQRLKYLAQPHPHLRMITENAPGRQMHEIFARTGPSWPPLRIIFFPCHPANSHTGVERESGHGCYG
jgi:hypothetical protein